MFIQHIAFSLHVRYALAHIHIWLLCSMHALTIDVILNTKFSTALSLPTLIHKMIYSALLQTS